MKKRALILIKNSIYIVNYETEAGDYYQLVHELGCRNIALCEFVADLEASTFNILKNRTTDYVGNAAVEFLLSCAVNISKEEFEKLVHNAWYK